MHMNEFLSQLAPAPVPQGVISPRAMRMIDPLYDVINAGAAEELMSRLVQTRPMERLRDISLSSVPGQWLPMGYPSSRYEHSMGVAHLAVRVCQRPEFAKHLLEMMVAAMFHDSGTVPFSHATEIFQHDATGLTHEQAAKLALADEAVATILAEHGVDAARVFSLITGEHPELGGILAGSIDLDNLDNSARLLRALGGAKEPPYSPERLSEAFVLESGQLKLDASYVQDIAGWVKCRDMLYTGLLYQDDRVAAGTMLYRALEFAYAAGLIDEQFFALGEGTALAYLRSRAMPLPVRQLIDRASCWQFYDCVLDIDAQDDLTRSRIMRLADDWKARKDFADELAKSLRVHPSFVTVQAGRDKGVKEIKLAFTGKDAAACSLLFDKPDASYSLKVFLAPDCREGTGSAAAELAVEMLACVEGIEIGHSFM